MCKQVFQGRALRTGRLPQFHRAFFHGKHHAIGRNQLGHRCHWKLAGGISYRFYDLAAVQQSTGHRIRGPLADLAKFTHALQPTEPSPPKARTLGPGEGARKLTAS